MVVTWRGGGNRRPVAGQLGAGRRRHTADRRGQPGSSRGGDRRKVRIWILTEKQDSATVPLPDP